ncbi:MAG: aldolase/citrate lyase family protein [Anaerolineales bacterium]
MNSQEHHALTTRNPLYMPGDDRRKIQKATTLSVDSICMDMEDGVAANKKAEAREVIAGAMKVDFGKSERCIRINQIGSELGEARPRRGDGDRSVRSLSRNRNCRTSQMSQRTHRNV